MKKTNDGKGGGGAEPANRSVNASLVHTANASINRDFAGRRAIEPGRPWLDDSVFDDFESDEELEKWRGEECDPGTVTDERYLQTIRPAHTQPIKQTPRFADEAVTLPRHLANYGAICNPWLDYLPGVTGNLYAPLIHWIAERRDLSAGVRIFYCACLRRARMATSRWLRVDLLVKETGLSTWMVNKYIRELKELGLIKRDRRWGLASPVHLVGPKGSYLDDMSKEKYYALLKKYPASSYMPVELMKIRGVSDQAKIVYARLHGLAGEKGFWFGTNATPRNSRRTLGLAESCGCSVATLRSAVRQLEAEKMIRVDRYGTGAGRRAMKPGGEHMHGGGQNVYHFLGHRLFRQPR